MLEFFFYLFIYFDTKNISWFFFFKLYYQSLYRYCANQNAYLIIDKFKKQIVSVAKTKR